MTTDAAVSPDTASSDLVLVIDDSAAFRGELEGALARAGFMTIGAADGAEGIRMATTLRPAAVIVDNVMPGMDGTTVIRRLRLDPHLRTTPCLMLTTSGDASAELGALDAGADASVRKSDDVELVVGRLSAMLRDGQGAELGEPLRAKRVLAIDDSPLYLSALGGLLRDEGYDVVLAPSGEEGIDVLAAQEVDCILLDCMMPGIGGIETCRRIKSAPLVGDVPVIMLTMLDGGDSVIEGLTAGADDYIAKSAGFEVINARIRSQIRRKRTEDERRRVRERLLHGERRAVEAQAAREIAEARAAMAAQLEKTSAELEAASRELEALSHSVSYGLRAPLRGITGFARALEEDLTSAIGEEHLDYLRRIQTSATRMGELVDSLLELARIEDAPLDVQRVDVTALAESVVGSLSAEERSVDVRVTPGLHVQGDPQLVRLLLASLLSNAWKFTSQTPGAAIEVGAHEARTFFVRDNGIGFDATNTDRLFLPFQRIHTGAEFAGLGIGLAIARRVVERHGGRIWAESAVGAGATFYFTLS
ncbi:MAG TPA: response regulator [Kofleriaceae bacterium]|nr:response regulator [Kofleriaceae bacterium]